MPSCAVLTCLRDTEEERYCAAALSREGGRICIDKSRRGIWAVDTFLFVHQDSPFLSTARGLSSIFDNHFSSDASIAISSNASRTKEPERIFKRLQEETGGRKQDFICIFSSDFCFTPKENGIERESNCAVSIDLFFPLCKHMVHVINLSLTVSHMDNTTED